MTELRRALPVVALTTLVLGILLGIGPVSSAEILAGYVLALAAIALAALTHASAEASEWQEASLFEYALRPRVVSPVRPPELVRVEREITLGSASAAHLEQRLLPLLREAAAARLAARHKVELDRRPEAARLLLGDEAWELLRPDRPEPGDRSAPGLPLRRIRDLVDTLERL